MVLDFSKKIFALAPLAGWTDLPFRETVKKFGADLTVSEMISSNALVHNSKKTKKMFLKSPIETPYSVQLVGSSAIVLKQAVEILNNESGIDIIDLNAGCPAPKVSGHGSGSALLKDLTLLGEIIKTIKKTSSKPLTSVKIRIGFDKKNGVDIAKCVEDAGADFLVVHGRTKVGGYKSEVDYDEIAKIKENIKIPVIANGDITSYEIAQKVLNHTKSDGVMIGRGAMGKPWIFKQLKEGKANLTNQEKRDVIMEHFDNMINFYGDFGAILFRKHLHNYSKGYKEASVFRDAINKIDCAMSAREIVFDFFDKED